MKQRELLKRRRVPAMGSLGWTTCDWCGVDIYDAYLMDGGPGALCEPCWDDFMAGGEPPQPGASARCAQWLRLVFDTNQQAAAGTSFPLGVRIVLGRFLIAPWIA